MVILIYLIKTVLVQKNKIEETHSKWKNREITAVMFMEMLEVRKNTFYKLMKEYESKLN